MKQGIAAPRNINPKSVIALKAVHLERKEKTFLKLNAAFARMDSGKTSILKPGFKWTFQALADETEIHVNTLMAKLSDGTHIYQTAINRLKSYASRRDGEKEDLVQKRLNSLKSQLTEVVTDRDNLLKQLDRMETAIIGEREKALAAILDKEAMVKRLRDQNLVV